MILRGHVVKPLPTSNAADSTPQDYWLHCGVDGGEFHLGCNDRVHVSAASCVLRRVCVFGGRQGDTCSQIVVHSEAVSLEGLQLQCCELHILGSAARLQRCTVAGDRQQRVGIRVRRPHAGAPAPAHVVLSCCVVRETDVALELLHVDGIEILDCECVPMLKLAEVTIELALSLLMLCAQCAAALHR